MALTKDEMIGIMLGLTSDIRGRFWDQMSRLEPRVSIEDLVQQVHMEAFSCLHQCEATEEQQFRGWVMTIAYNKANRFYWNHRTNGDSSLNKEAVVIGVSAGGEDGDGWLPKDKIATPDQMVETAEQVDLLNQAIDRLQPNIARIVRLRHFEGLPWAKVGEIVGMHKDAARHLGAFGFKTLQEDLGGNAETKPETETETEGLAQPAVAG